MVGRRLLIEAQAAEVKSGDRVENRCQLIILGSGLHHYYRRSTSAPGLNSSPFAAKKIT
jgi:hypothetical protein